MDYLLIINKNDSQTDSSLVWKKQVYKGFCYWFQHLESYTGSFRILWQNEPLKPVWIPSLENRNVFHYFVCLFLCMSVNIKLFEFTNSIGLSDISSREIWEYLCRRLVISWDCLRLQVTSPGTMAASRLLANTMQAARIHIASNFSCFDAQP